MINYKQKYIKYKSKYLDIQSRQNDHSIHNVHNVHYVMGGKVKKCNIDKDDKILFGDGGSTAIILLSKNKAYKVFTTFVWTGMDKKKMDTYIVEQNKRVDNEIAIYKELTNNIINKNISQHFVKYYGESNCDNASKLFKDCPKYNEFLKINKEKQNKLCLNKYKNYPNLKLNEKYRVVEIEYCDYSCGDFIQDVSELGVLDMEKMLDIFFFQIAYTLVSVKKKYPYFSHNDLFMRNILGNKEKDNGNYYTYEINNKKYYVPQLKFFPKINDFGITNLNEKYRDGKLFKSDVKDIYNILLDVYNGGNVGAKSLMELCKDYENKKKFLKKYFGNYFDVDIIDEYIANNKNIMDWSWNNILDEEFMKSTKIQSPEYLLDNYFNKIFGKINENVSKFYN